jgi:ABC-type Fe3+-hydroxamate transport system substrate-binding protein
MIAVTDQLNRKVSVNEGCTIISLVPSQTELLFDLGCGERVIGITKFCIHPEEWFLSKKRIGGTKDLHLEKIKALNPGLIIANKEENTKEQIDELASLFPVYISDVNSVDEACEMIRDIGILTQTLEVGEVLISQIKTDFQTLPNFDKRVLYLIWRNPFMIVGNQTFIGHLLHQLGLKNCLDDPSLRYVEVSLAEIKAFKPELIFLSSEPYPFKAKDCKQMSHEVGAPTLLVDGEMFSWYGSRMTKMKGYFQKLEAEIKAL